MPHTFIATGGMGFFRIHYRERLLRAAQILSSCIVVRFTGGNVLFCFFAVGHSVSLIDLLVIG